MSLENVEQFEDLESDSSSSSWEDVHEGEMDGEDIACHPLLTNSLILEKIFNFLVTKDLLECRRVCKEWNKTALLRKVLGSRFKITISKANFDRLLKTAQNSAQPFCRQFEFRLLELEYDKVSKFIRLFGERLSRLAIKFCTASSSESVIQILNCPRLEELTIYGALPEIREENFHTFKFSRLTAVSLNSSLDYGQVDKTFIRILLSHAPNLNTINVGQSIQLWIDFCTVYPVKKFKDPKLCNIGLSGIEGPLQIEHFQGFLKKLSILREVNFQNCLVQETFFGQLLLETSKKISAVRIDGTQQEILSRSFRDIALPNLTDVALPVDGISITDGPGVLQSAPNLRRLKIMGLFTSTFIFKDGKLLSICFKEKCSTSVFSRDVLQQLDEKRREFLKVVSIIPCQPQRLELCSSVSFIDSKCIRAIYRRYPLLEHLVIGSISAKAALVGLTGIPYRLCKGMAHCKSFAVLYPHQVTMLPSIQNLKKLKRLDVAITGETLTAELTLLLVVYGIAGLSDLSELCLYNAKISDVSLMVLSKKLELNRCLIEGSEEQWNQFQSVFQNHTIKSFLLPPNKCNETPRSASEVVGKDSRILRNILVYMDSADMFEARKVCCYWRCLISDILHDGCSFDEHLTTSLKQRIFNHERTKSCPPSPNKQVYYLGEAPRDTPAFLKVLKIWSSLTKETTLAIVSLGKSALDLCQYENRRVGSKKRFASCQDRRQLEYWYYPDGSDDLMYKGKQVETKEELFDDLPNIDVLLVIGHWGRKDNGLLELLNPKWPVSKLYLVGLQKEALDLVLPKVTVMMNLEYLQMRPFLDSTPYCDVTKTHLQILCNSSFKLKQLTMQLYGTADSIVDFVRSQRFTLESINIHCNINVSDRLTFSIPQLKVLQLDEPPGCLWTILNVHSNLETINFGRSGNSYNQVKNKSSPKVDSLDVDLFEHSATELLCDVNWFLENATTKRSGVQKSILQQSSDSALKFFMHFPFLTSLTLKGVHGHYSILQGIFKKFTQLKKLILVNATGVTDEILTGFTKEILEEMDIMNPFQVTRERAATTPVKGKSSVSIRNLKCLTHLSLDDQPSCSDFSVIFGILKLNQLEHFSCKKWKITDVSLRACADILPALKEINVDGCANVSKYALNYFSERRACCRQAEPAEE